MEPPPWEARPWSPQIWRLVKSREVVEREGKGLTEHRFRQMLRLIALAQVRRARGPGGEGGLRRVWLNQPRVFAGDRARFPRRRAAFDLD